MKNIHVLVIPSWYTTRENSLRGIFFKEQTKNLQNLGAKVGIIYPEIRWLSELNLKSLKVNHFNTTEEVEDGMVTFRKHAWNIYPKLPKKQASNWVKQAIKLADKYIKKYGVPDIIQAHSTLWGGYAAMILSKKYNIPYIVTEHCSDYILTEVDEWKKEEMIKVFKNSSKVLAVSSDFAERLKVYLGETSIEVIHNSVDTEFFRLKKDVKKENFEILNVGFLNKNKGVDTLIRAFGKAFHDIPNIRLKIGSNGKELENLKKICKELHIEDKVIFLGGIDRQEVRDNMMYSDLFVLSSRFETFGVVLIEALATGTPIIATKCGGPQDIVTEKVGKLVDVDDIDGLAKTLEFMYQNYDCYNKKEIREYCCEKFSNKVIGENTLKIYNDIIKS